MGLDVYLYHCPDRKTAKAIENEYEQRSEANWKEVGEFDKLTEKQQEAVRKKNHELAVALEVAGGPEEKFHYDGHHKSVTKVELPSKLYPEHYFKIGYFRSSYNSSGIERILGNLGIGGLYEIFEPNEEYEFTPDWKKAHQRVNESIAEYEAHLAGIAGKYGIMKIGYNMFKKENSLPQNEEAAWQIFKKEVEGKDDLSLFDWYSNGDGHFFLKDPPKVVAAIPGVENILGKAPCVYLFYDKEREEGKKDWYLQALEIVREAIEYVLAQPDPQNYYLHWSS